jgi:hypothetical protein
MEQRPSTLERAFDLARSGGYRYLTDILTALRREGHADARRHLDGAGIQRQLKELMASAQRRTDAE